jgi:hypothetical protein
MSHEPTPPVAEPVRAPNAWPRPRLRTDTTADVTPATSTSVMNAIEHHFAIFSAFPVAIGSNRLHAPSPGALPFQCRIL